MSTVIYPVIFVKEDNRYLAIMIDFNKGAYGSDLAHAIQEARCNIGKCIYDCKKNNIPIPAPESVDCSKFKNNPNCIFSYVDVDLDEYSDEVYAAYEALYNQQEEKLLSAEEPIEYEDVPDCSVADSIYGNNIFYRDHKMDVYDSNLMNTFWDEPITYEADEKSVEKFQNDVASSGIYFADQEEDTNTQKVPAVKKQKPKKRNKNKKPKKTQKRKKRKWFVLARPMKLKRAGKNHIWNKIKSSSYTLCDKKANSKINHTSTGRSSRKKKTYVNNSSIMDFVISFILFPIVVFIFFIKLFGKGGRRRR